MKAIKLTILFIALAIGANAQIKKFFKVIPKPRAHFAMIGDSTVATFVDEKNEIRPVANIASYAIPGNSLLIGAGAAYEHLKYNPKTDAWDEVWSINALAWNKASLDNGSNTFAYGLAAGIAGKVIVGAATSDFKSFMAT